MRYLLVGGIGYIGGRLSAYLKGQGHYVRLTTRRMPAQVPSWVLADDVVSADLQQVDPLDAAMRSIDQVIDLAAPDELEAAHHPASALHAGAVQTWNILEALSRQPIGQRPRLLYLSTFHVYGPEASGEINETTLPAPVHPYAIARYLGEVIVQSFRKAGHVKALIVRLSNVMGAAAHSEVPRWSLVFNDLCRQAISQNQLILKTPGQQKRNFITLEDTVRALDFLSTQGRWPEDGILHLGSSVHWSIREVAEKVAEVCLQKMGRRPAIQTTAGTKALPPVDFHFNIERLRALGFKWNDLFDREIENILDLLRHPSSDCASTAAPK
jgi:UDP-glucose 4-epimerase